MCTSPRINTKLAAQSVRFAKEMQGWVGSMWWGSLSTRFFFIECSNASQGRGGLARGLTRPPNGQAVGLKVPIGLLGAFHNFQCRSPINQPYATAEAKLNSESLNPMFFSFFLSFDRCLPQLYPSDFYSPQGPSLTRRRVGRRQSGGLVGVRLGRVRRSHRQF